MIFFYLYTSTFSPGIRGFGCWQASALFLHNNTPLGALVDCTGILQLGISGFQDGAR